MNFRQVELGLNTFGDLTIGSQGELLTHHQVIRNVVVEALLAERAGVGVFGVGEHHRSDYAVSAPEVLLAAVAACTQRIRIGSAATVLGADDPVRVFQRFSTLSAISNGRAEIVLGCGWFNEAVRLFPQERSSPNTVFEEKLGLLTKLLRDGVIPDRDASRPPTGVMSVSPPLAGVPLKAWIAVGASPDSVLRAARYGCSLMLAVIGGEPQRFKVFAELYRQACEKLGKPVGDIGVHSAGYIADTDAEAREKIWPFYKRTRDALGAERGWPPISRSQYETEIDRGSLYIGSPKTVAQRIAETVTTLGLSRFSLKYSAGELPHEALLRSIELYGTEVIPLVRKALA